MFSKQLIFAKYPYMCIYVYISKHRSISSKSCIIYVHIFRAYCLQLDNRLMCSFLGKTISPTLRISFLSVVLCEVEASLAFPVSLLAHLILSFLDSCLGNHVGLGYCLLQKEGSLRGVRTASTLMYKNKC